MRSNARVLSQVAIATLLLHHRGSQPTTALLALGQHLRSPAPSTIPLPRWIGARLDPPTSSSHPASFRSNLDVAHLATQAASVRGALSANACDVPFSGEWEPLPLQPPPSYCPSPVLGGCTPREGALPPPFDPSPCTVHRPTPAHASLFRSWVVHRHLLAISVGPAGLMDAGLGWDERRNIIMAARRYGISSTADLQL